MKQTYKIQKTEYHENYKKVFFTLRYKGHEIQAWKIGAFTSNLFWNNSTILFQNFNGVKEENNGAPKFSCEVGFLIVNHGFGNKPPVRIPVSLDPDPIHRDYSKFEQEITDLYDKFCIDCISKENIFSYVRENGVKFSFGCQNNDYFGMVCNKYFVVREILEEPNVGYDYDHEYWCDGLYDNLPFVVWTFHDWAMMHISSPFPECIHEYIRKNRKISTNNFVRKTPCY